MYHYSFNENISYHVLMELALSSTGEYDENKIIEKALPTYLRKLNCYAAAIFEFGLDASFDLKKVLPKTFPETKEWNTITSIIKQITHPGSSKEPYYEFLNDASAYYIFELPSYGYLLLCGNKGFSNLLKNELLGVLQNLAKSLVLAKEINQRKKFENKLYETVHQLDLLYSFMNLSQDAIQVSREDGQLVFINRVASERLGINQSEVHEYNVVDIELNFKGKAGLWEKHVEELKETGKLIINGKNINQRTNESFYVEVTVSYQSIDNIGYIIAISRDITKRKEAEFELLKTKEFLENISHISMTGGIEVNPEIGHIALNKIAYKILDIDENIKKPSVLRRSFMKTINSSKELKKQFKLIDQRPEGINGEFEIVTQKGNRKFLKIIANIQPNQDNIIIGAIQDITEKTIAQRQLETSENKFRSYVESANEIIFSINGNGLILYISPNVKDRIGYEQSELINHYIKDFVHPDDYQHAITAITEIVRTGIKHTNIVYRVRNSNGHYLWYIMSGSPLYDEHGKISSVLAVAHDISAIKNAEDQLKQAKQKAENLALQYKTILDTQSVFILKLDKKGKIKYVNDYYIKAIGYHDTEKGRAELSELKMTSRLQEEECAKLNETLKNSVKNPNSTYSLLLKENIKNQKGKIIRWEIKSLETENKNKEFILVGVDITEQMVNLERANHLINITSSQNFKLKNFAYIVSHNIRSHSSNITGLIRELKEIKDDDERIYFLNLLEAGSNKLEETIRNLNEIIAINEGTDKQYVKKHLKTEVDRTFDILSNAIISNNINIINNVDENIYVNAVASYLDSILLNMISNAVKYRSEVKPEITVSAQMVEKFIQITFKDNGLGIDLKKHGDKLFGMYKTFHRNADSRGLGLFITKAQVEAMGGKVDVESAPGKGTSFIVYLLKYEL
jgi:PAS domain S-box-containing protein